MLFDLAVLTYNSTTDDRIDFSSLPYALFLFGLGLFLEMVLEEKCTIFYSEGQ